MTQTPMLPGWASKAMIVMVVAMLIGGVLVVKRFLEVRPREVPSVVNQPVEDAKATLKAAGFGDSKINQRPDDVVPANNVIDQLPKAGDFLGGRQSVSLVVSTGPSNIKVPSVVGKSSADAIDVLKKLKLNPVVDDTKALPNDAPKGQILSQDPAENEQVPPNTTIHLVPSAGPQGVSVPDFTGKTEDAARDLANSKNLIIVPIRQKDPNGKKNATKPGAAWKQSPAPGTDAKPNAQITVTFEPDAPAGTTTSSAPPAAGN